MPTVLCLATNSKRIYAVIADEYITNGKKRVFLARSQPQPSSIETKFELITPQDYKLLDAKYLYSAKVSCAVAEEPPSSQQDSMPSIAIMMATNMTFYDAFQGTMYTAVDSTANNSTNMTPQSMVWKEIKSSLKWFSKESYDHQVLVAPSTPAGFVHVAYRTSGDSLSASISAIKDGKFEDYSTIFRSPSKALGGSYLSGYSKDQLIAFQQAVHGRNDTITYSSFNIDSKTGLPSSKTPNTSTQISLAHCNDGLNRVGGNDGTSIHFWCRSDSAEELYTYNHSSSAISKLGNVQGAIPWGYNGPSYLPMPLEASAPWGLVYVGGLYFSEVRQTSLNVWQYNSTASAMSLSGYPETNSGGVPRFVENFFTRLGIRILIAVGVPLLCILAFIVWCIYKFTGLCRKPKRKTFVVMEVDASEE